MAKRAVKSFVAAGISGVVKVGNSYPDNHPAVRMNPHLFEEIDDPEQATARPGERRVLGQRSREARAEAQRDAQEPSETHECDECDFVAETPQGLGSHKRTHSSKEDN